MAVEDKIPSKRAGDIAGEDLFDKKIKQAGFASKADFNDAYRAAGGDFKAAGHKAAFKDFLNYHLRQAAKESSDMLVKDVVPYKNIMTDTVKKNFERLAGGVEPGRIGAPENKAYYQAAMAAEADAKALYPEETKAAAKKRLSYLKKAIADMGVPRAWIKANIGRISSLVLGVSSIPTAIASGLLYAGTAKPLGAKEDEMFEKRDAEKRKKEMMDKYNVTQEQMNQIANQPIDLLAPRKNMGGMMDINNMIRPLRSR